MDDLRFKRPQRGYPPLWSPPSSLQIGLQHDDECNSEQIKGLEDKVNDRVNPDESEGIEEKTTDKKNDIAVSLHQIACQFKFVHKRHLSVILIWKTGGGQRKQSPLACPGNGRMLLREGHIPGRSLPGPEKAGGDLPLYSGDTSEWH